MARSCLAASLPLVGALVVLATAAPVPKAVNKAPTYPFALGDRWEYVGDQERTEEIVAVDDAPDGKAKDYTFKLTYAGGRTITQVARVDKDSIAYIRTDSGGGGTLRQPFVIAKLPLVEGAEWEAVWEDSDFKFAFQLKVGRSETIKVAGKKLSATPVVWRDSDNKKVATIWFADGLGVVRTVRDPKSKTNLKSFVPGKLDKQ